MNLVYSLTSAILITAILINSHFSYTQAKNVNHYLKRFSKLNFDKNDLINRHNRIKRSLDDHIKLKFRAHGKEFEIKLVPTETNFEKDFIEINNKNVPITDFKIYEGKLVDEPDSSYVSGAIIDGIFIGKIESKKDGIYYIESAKRYDDIYDANTIIYHENDVNTNEQVFKKINQRSNKEVVNENNLEGEIGCGSTNKNNRDKIYEEQTKIAEEIRKKRDLKDESEPIDFKYKKERNKRQTDTFPNGKTVCNLYLKVDPYFYETIFNKEGNKNEVLTRNYITFYLNQQVSSLNQIFKKITSNESPYFNTLSFKIYRTKIYRLNDCSGLSDVEKRLCENYLDAVTFLNYVSLDNYTDYCLSFTFTSRDFSDGTLGLAYLATTSGAVGGICEKPVSIQGVSRSLNSGIVTIVNYNSRVPEIVNQLTFAHEVGHTFGSNHDPDTAQCSPGSSIGNYIMYSRATTGKQTNNNKFSSCSISDMNNILKSLLPSTKNCLRVPNESICGNGIIEDGEVCDTGSSNSTCCIACRTRNGECDPSEGPCCDPNTCRFYRDNRICLASNDCSDDIKCNNVSAACPIQQNKFFKPDLSLCNDNTQVCRSGICTDSICDKFGLKQCYIEGDLLDKNVDKSNLCKLACTGNLTQFQCKLTKDIYVFNGQSYSLRPGSACASTFGYCDIFSRCRYVNSTGVLSKLVKTLSASSILSIDDLKTFATTYWWAILLFCLAFLALNGLFLFCTMKCMNSDNPEKQRKDRMKKPLVTNKNAPIKNIRNDTIRPITREITPRNNIFFNDNSDSSDINIRQVSTGKLKKIRRTPRSDE